MTGLNFKHTQRQADGWQSHKPHAGMRDIPEGNQEWTLPIKILPGTTVQASLMFETQQGQVEEMRTFELLSTGRGWSSRSYSQRRFYAVARTCSLFSAAIAVRCDAIAWPADRMAPTVHSVTAPSYR